MTVAYHGHTIRRWPQAVSRWWSHPVAPASPLLGNGEHRLLSETCDDGTARYVGTEKALYHRADGAQAWRRIAWVDIARVEHSRRTDALTLRGWPGEAPVPTRLIVQAGSRLPDLARERVTACQLLVRHVRLDDGTGVLVTALRESGTDEALWSAQVVHRSGGLTGPALSAAIDRAVREIRAEAGC